MNKFTANIQADGPNVTLADNPTVTLTLQHPPGYTVNAAQLRQNLLLTGHTLETPFEIASEQVQQSTEKTSLSYTLKLKAEGSHKLSFGVILFSNGTNEERLVSDVINFYVKSTEGVVLQPDSVLPLTPHPVAELKGDNRQHQLLNTLEQPAINRSTLQEHTFPWHYIAIYLTTVFLIFLMGKTLRKLWKRRAPVSQAPNPKETALKELNSLTEKTLAFDPFYTRLTQVLRTYLEGAYAIPASELTTEEFLAYLSKSETFAPAKKEQLKQLLQHADRVKFAQQPSSEEQKQTALNHVYTLIKK